MFRVTIAVCLALRFLTIATPAQEKPSDIPLDAVSHGTKTYLFLYRDGKIRRLGEFNSSGFGWIEVKHVSSSKVIFLLRTQGTPDRGDNPLFVFDGTQLLRIKEPFELYDAAVDPAGRRIAYCYWAGDKRHIVVKNLIRRCRIVAVDSAATPLVTSRLWSTWM